MVSEHDKRMVKNSETAKKIADKYFSGARLYGFDPNWTFIISKGNDYCCDSTFTIPNFIMKNLANEMGLQWYDDV